MCNLINIHAYIHTYIHKYMHTYCRGPDCAVMCNLINIHTYIHTYINTYIHTYCRALVGQKWIIDAASRKNWRKRSLPLLGWQRTSVATITYSINNVDVLVTNLTGAGAGRKKRAVHKNVTGKT